MHLSSQAILLTTNCYETHYISCQNIKALQDSVVENVSHPKLTSKLCQKNNDFLGSGREKMGRKEEAAKNKRRRMKSANVAKNEESE